MIKKFCSWNLESSFYFESSKSEKISNLMMRITLKQYQYGVLIKNHEKTKVAFFKFWNNSISESWQCKYYYGLKHITDQMNSLHELSSLLLLDYHHQHILSPADIHTCIILGKFQFLIMKNFSLCLTLKTFQLITCIPIFQYNFGFQHN